MADKGIPLTALATAAALVFMAAGYALYVMHKAGQSEAENAEQEYTVRKDQLSQISATTCFVRVSSVYKQFRADITPSPIAPVVYKFDVKNALGCYEFVRSQSNGSGVKDVVATLMNEGEFIGTIQCAPGVSGLKCKDTLSVEPQLDIK